MAKELTAYAITANLSAGWPFGIWSEGEDVFIDGIQMTEDGNLNANGKRIEDALRKLSGQLIRQCLRKSK